jgi:hypothetical protein
LIDWCLGRIPHFFTMRPNALSIRMRSWLAKKRSYRFAWPLHPYHHQVGHPPG